MLAAGIAVPAQLNAVLREATLAEDLSVMFANQLPDVRMCPPVRGMDANVREVAAVLHHLTAPLQCHLTSQVADRHQMMKDMP